MNAWGPLATILLAGFFGSWHCAAMCGPIAIALGRRGRTWPYHLGRGIAYVTAGAIAGTIGKAILMQPSFAFRLGSFTFLSALFLLTLWRRVPFSNSSSRPTQISAWEKFIYSKVRARRGALALGLLSVLLPCGWLWTFILAASATGNPLAGGLVMASMWASALPAFSFLNSYFSASMRRSSLRTQNWISYAMVTAGLYSLWSHFFWV